jgi:hypothetical protein
VNSFSEGISSGKILNLFVESLAEPVRHLKHPSVTDQLYDVSGSVEYCCAMRADFEMRFHSFTRLGRDLFVKIVGDFAPDFDATDFDGRHSSLLSYQALTFRNGVPLIQEPSIPGARQSLNTNRAR